MLGGSKMKMVGPSGPPPPELDPLVLVSSESSSGSDFVIPSCTSSQVLVLMERNRYSSALQPLRAGFTDIVSISNGTRNQSMRVSYIIGNTTFTIADTNYGAAYIIFDCNGAINIAQTDTNEQTTSSTSQPIPAVSGINTDGKSWVLAINYAPKACNYVNGAYTWSEGWCYNTGNTTGSIGSTTMHMTTSVYKFTCVFEIRP
ncbi:MAG: hypothetical protein GC184_06060 [Rhizobiales bacterium]|nr:hypothetical protein [Hyphomicrobiales bacterium]